MQFDYRLMTFDFRALNHIIGSPVYEKPWQTRKILSRLLGRGVFAIEGQEHRWQVCLQLQLQVHFLIL
jgi:hypothetical protein